MKLNTKALVNRWFEVWETGDFKNIPVSEDFVHNSPYGTINGKDNYLKLVQENLDKFLGHQFEIHDALYLDNKACVRYTGIKENFRLDVSEWYYTSEGEINKIFAYYNIEGEISEERKLKRTD